MNLGACLIHFCVGLMERDEQSFLVLHIPGKILGYSFGDRTLKTICDVAVGTGNEILMLYSSYSSYQYDESLSDVSIGMAFSPTRPNPIRSLLRTSQQFGDLFGGIGYDVEIFF